METKLKFEHAQFVQEYLIDFNGTRAYGAIYPDSSEEAARTNASRLLTNDNIKKSIEKGAADKIARTQITQDKVLAELALIGFSRMDDYVEFGPGGLTLKELSDLTPDQIASISEVSETVGSQGGGSVKFKLHDKQVALLNIGKHLGMFKENVNVKHSGIVTHEHEGLPATLEFLRGFQRERGQGDSTEPLPN